MLIQLRRLPIRLPRPLWVGLVIVVFSVSPASADGQVDEESNADAPAEKQAKTLDPVVYRLVFGIDSDAAGVRKHIDMVLRQKVGAIDLICELSEGQRQKLELAARGDFIRLLARVEAIGRQFPLVRKDPDKINALHRETELLERMLKTPFTNDGSLLDKSMKTVLSQEQSARIALLGEIEQRGGRVQTEALPPIAMLEIYLSGVAFDDDGLSRLAKLKNLQGLDLTSTQITDAGLAHLEKLEQLRWLDLTGTDVNDAGLAHLVALTRLERLDLFGTQVTSTGLVSLKGLTSLKELNLSSTSTTDAGLADLEELKNLEVLNLRGTQVTDAGLTHLKELRSLEWLDVGGTMVTDSGLAHLNGLTNLRWVNLSNTSVTDAGLAALALELPMAKIWKRREPAAD